MLIFDSRRMRATQEELEAVSGTSFAAETNCRDEDADMYVTTTKIHTNQCLLIVM